MSEQHESAPETINLEDLSSELQQVMKYEQVPVEMHGMLVSVHEVSEPTVREAWDELPASAQNVLDNFEQFHALVSLSQSYAGVDFLSQYQDAKIEDLDDKQAEEYKAQLLLSEEEYSID